MTPFIYYNVCFHMKPIGSFELEENAEKYAEAERQRRLRVLEYKKADLTEICGWGHCYFCFACLC